MEGLENFSLLGQILPAALHSFKQTRVYCSLAPSRAQAAHPAAPPCSFCYLSSRRRGWTGLGQGLAESGSDQSSLGILNALHLPWGAWVLRAPYPLTFFRVHKTEDPWGSLRWPKATFFVLRDLQQLLSTHPHLILSPAIEGSLLWMLAETSWRGKLDVLSGVTHVR